MSVIHRFEHDIGIEIKRFSISWYSSSKISREVVYFANLVEIISRSESQRSTTISRKRDDDIEDSRSRIEKRTVIIPIIGRNPFQKEQGIRGDGRIEKITRGRPWNRKRSVIISYFYRRYKRTFTTSSCRSPLWTSSEKTRRRTRSSWK